MYVINILVPVYLHITIEFSDMKLITNKINYTKLRDLLAAGEWQEADLETARVILAIAGRDRNSLDNESIDNFPCEDLHTIDQLWIEYSKGRFGFSVQKRIYQILSGTKEHWEIWQEFSVIVGWNASKDIYDEAWLYYDEITFNLTAPQGHLPLFLKDASRGLVISLPIGERFLSRVDTCNL